MSVPRVERYVAWTIDRPGRTGCAHPRKSLCEFVRHEPGLPDGPVGCELDVRGARTVPVDGRAIPSVAETGEKGP